MTREAFLNAVDRNAARVQAYRSGGTGKDGTCDCIGLIMGAFALCGETWKGIHGSNYAAREAVNQLHSVTDASQLRAGQIVFKYRLLSDDGYSLPERYRSGHDLRDYYHVGVVRSVDPLDIIHCTSPGPIAHDRKLGRWRMAADLKAVQGTGKRDPGDDSLPGGEMENRSQEKAKMSDAAYEHTAGNTVTARVESGNGNGANLRASKSVSSKRLEKLPEGAQLSVISQDDTWAKVEYAGIKGYVKKEFLVMEDEASPIPSAGGDRLTIALDRAACLKIYEACAMALGLGVG